MVEDVTEIRNIYIGEEKAHGPQRTNYYPVHKKSIFKKTELTISSSNIFNYPGSECMKHPRESRTFN